MDKKKKDAYEELCKDLKLCPRLIPFPLWSYSIANLVRIETRIIEAIKEGYSRIIDETKNWWFSLARKGKCEVCGDLIEDGEIDEEWLYYVNEENSSGVAYLNKIRLICKNCHLAKHQGYAKVINKSEEALKYFAKINELSIHEAKMLVNSAFNIHSNLNKIREWSFKIKLKGFHNKEVEELLELLYKGKYILEGDWLYYYNPRYYEEVEPKIIEETLHTLNSIKRRTSKQEFINSLLEFIKEFLKRYGIEVLEKEFKYFMNLILEPTIFKKYSDYYPDVLDIESLMENIIQHKNIKITTIPSLLKGKWFLFTSPENCPTLFINIINRLKDEKIAYGGKIHAFNKNYNKSELPVFIYVPSSFALDTIARVVEIMKEELSKKGLTKRIYFKPDIFTDQRIYSSDKGLKSYIYYIK